MLKLSLDYMGCSCKKFQAEQALQDRKAAKKRAEEERISKLSASEQRKVSLFSLYSKSIST